MTEHVPPAVEVAVAVVIVTHQSASYIDACLDSIVGQGIGSIVVVDSGSTDTTLQIVERKRAAIEQRGVRLVIVDTKLNTGFGSAANRGVAACREPFVMILNPDTEVASGAIGTLRAVLEADVGLGAIGPQVRNPDGSTYPSARAFPEYVTAGVHAFLGSFWPTNPFSRRYLHPEQVDWISGTALMVRRRAFEQIGGFDERFFMYVEDVDLCWRWRQLGIRVDRTLSAGVMHHIGGSTKTRPVPMLIAHHRSLWRFALRSTVGVRRSLLPLTALGILARFVVLVVAEQRFQQPAAARHR